MKIRGARRGRAGRSMRGKKTRKSTDPKIPQKCVYCLHYKDDRNASDIDASDAGERGGIM